jgi:hypothetical protein
LALEEVFSLCMTPETCIPRFEEMLRTENERQGSRVVYILRDTNKELIEERIREANYLRLAANYSG